eukprot:6186660-Pleurochrysis_carterae.AAC.2
MAYGPVQGRLRNLAQSPTRAHAACANSGSKDAHSDELVRRRSKTHARARFHPRVRASAGARINVARALAPLACAW